MGKLHTLRRAIERNPKKWHSNGGYVYGARYLEKPPWWNWREWEGPGWYPQSEYAYPKSYRAFVRSVLVNMGYV
jgi:hypothetical protein